MEKKIVDCVGPLVVISLVLTVVTPIMLQIQAQKPRKDNANSKFDDHCIKVFTNLKEAGMDLEKIIDKLEKQECR